MTVDVAQRYAFHSLPGIHSAPTYVVHILIRTKKKMHYFVVNKALISFAKFGLLKFGVAIDVKELKAEFKLVKLRFENNLVPHPVYAECLINRYVVLNRNSSYHIISGMSCSENCFVFIHFLL